jgi:hypothetical protein
MSKRLFIYLSEGDLQIGKPLPWSVYVRSGELLAPAGFLISDSAARARLMAARPLRVAVGNERSSPLAVPDDDDKRKRKTKQKKGNNNINE